MELTAEQAAVVSARGSDVVVTAGAGSGKTRVLVEHFIGLLADHALPEVVAVTFTEAAAAEMRERVRREVLTRPELSAHRADLDRAVIGTIHSLCLRLLREHPVEAGIDPGARVLAEDEAEFELQASCAEALEAAADVDDERARAIRAVGDYQLSRQLPLMVARRDDVRAAFRALPGETAGEREAGVRALLEKAFASRLETAWAEALSAAARAQALLPPGAEGRLAETVRETAERLAAAAGRGDEERARALEAAASAISLQGAPRREWAELAKGELRTVRAAAARPRGAPRWNEHDPEALALLPGLRGLFEDACSRYGARKRSLHALDFLDLELHAVRLLREHEAVAEECRRRFRYVMVDECQDTNPLQVELIRLLTGRRDGSPGAVRLFAVGDQKQAIYRFRGSDVRHFGRLAREIEASGGRSLPLSRSFRAHDPLVGTLNEIFGAVFDQAGGEFDVPMQAMTGRGREAPGGVHLVAAPVSGRGPGAERAEARDVLRVEADLVAGEIAALLERGDPVWDRRRDGYRPARPGDVAILLRRLRSLRDFEHALESRGVPYATPAGGGFFSRPEVVDLTNLLRWIAEPDDEIALLGVLRSPMVLLDDPTLLELRRDGGRLFSGLASPPEAAAPGMRARARSAHALLADLRAHAGSLPTHELLAEALERSGVESVWGALRGGEQSLANIRKFVRLARELADRPLDGFVDYVERRRDDLDAREGQAVVDRPDAVQLMTVHAAKGLEFPVVVVPEAQSEAFSGWEAVRWRAGEGLGITLLPPPEATDRRRLRPGFYAWLRERDLAEEEAEHDRLLYVAATRAADYLYISGSGNGKGWLETVRATLAEAGRDGVELREPVPADTSAVAKRLSPAAVRPPREAEEREYVPPLLARPPVIPVRASTPVTALRPRPERQAAYGHGDGLGALRGTVAHRAVELAFTGADRPDLAELIREESGWLLDEQLVRVLAGEIEEMLALFERSRLAATLREPSTERHFELPFAWNWDGVPVHGAIDLVYRDPRGWHVVDFKTDELRGRTIGEASAPYLVQLALYGGAIEHATGERPGCALLFLRNGELHAPGEAALREALAAARELVDAGGALEPEIGESREVEESPA